MKNIIFLLLFTSGIASCRNQIPASNIESEKEIIYQVIQNTTGWAKTKDTTLLYSIIADDEDYLEVHPGDKVVKGITEFKKAEDIWLDDRFKHIRFKTSDLHINLSSGGEVAWFYCILDDINEWDGQPSAWENTRWTGVLEKRDGRWQMVQMHFSFPFSR